LIAALKPQEKGVESVIRRLARLGKAVAFDQSGQTMLEYVVIIVFVVIAAIVAFRIIAGIVTRGARRASASFKI
jgi:Flp pilus assembly pilin Flp